MQIQVCFSLQEGVLQCSICFGGAHIPFFIHGPKFWHHLDGNLKQVFTIEAFSLLGLVKSTSPTLFKNPIGLNEPAELEII